MSQQAVSLCIVMRRNINAAQAGFAASIGQIKQEMMSHRGGKTSSYELIVTSHHHMNDTDDEVTWSTVVSTGTSCRIAHYITK